MPYPNEHAARVREPDDFEPGSFRRKQIADGVSLVLGKLKGETTMTAQAYRFDKQKFTPAEARAWLKEHDIKPTSFEEASDNAKADELPSDDDEQQFSVHAHEGQFCVFYKGEQTPREGMCRATQEEAQALLDEMQSADYEIEDEPSKRSAHARDRLVGGGKVPRSKIPDDDFVFSDERTFPILNRQDVRAAVSSWGRYRGQHSFADFKSKLTAIAKRKGWEGQLPQSWKDEERKAADDETTSALLRSLGAVKTLGEMELDVLGVPYGGPNGGKDSQGEFFSPQSKLHLERFPKPLVHYYHGYTPDGKPQGEPVIIGEVKSIEVRSDGVWYRVALNKASEYARRIWEAARKGLARASSGTLAHLRRVAAGGHIENWPVAELSLMDVEGNQRLPANGYAVALPAAKSHYDAAGLQFPELESEQDDLPADRGAKQGSAAESDAQSESTQTKRQGVNAMDDKELGELIAKQVAESTAAAMKAHNDKQEAERKAAEDEKKKIDEAVKAARSEWETEALKSNRLHDGVTPFVAKYPEVWQFDHLDAGDAAVMCGLLMAAKSKGLSKGPSEALLRAVAIKMSEDKGDVGKFGRPALKALGLYDEKGGLKANELNYSTQANYGDEWIGVGYASAIWEGIRVGTFVTSKLPSMTVPRGVESFTIPIESADPVFYNVAEATDEAATKWPAGTIISSKLGTAKATMNLGKMGAVTRWTGEMEERSMAPFAAQLRSQFVNAGAEQLEHLIIDGDTATGATTNINHIGGTPTTGDLYLMLNGFRKSPLVTTTANSRSAGGSLVGTDFIATLALMGAAGKNALDRTKVSFIIDPNVHWKALDLPEVKTRDVFAQPTIENGRLTAIYGYPVDVSGNMHWKSAALKANTAGKVDQTTPANNTTGAILAVRWDQWLLGYQRQMTLEATRIARADAYELVAMMVLGLTQRDTEASAITYNVGV